MEEIKFLRQPTREDLQLTPKERVYLQRLIDWERNSGDPYKLVGGPYRNNRRR